MEIQNNNTEKNYQDLFSGKIKYLVTSHTQVGRGHKPFWIKVFFWNLFHKDKLSYGYPCKSHIYHISTALKDRVIFDWGDNDTKTFIETHNLHDGDKLNVYFMVPRDNGTYWCAGGREYTITENGWRLTDKIRGT